MLQYRYTVLYYLYDLENIERTNYRVYVSTSTIASMLMIVYLEDAVWSKVVAQ